MNYYTKQEVAEILGYDIRSVTRIMDQVIEKKGIAWCQNHISKGGYHNRELIVDEELLKEIQIVAQMNVMNAASKHSQLNEDNIVPNQTEQSAKQNLQMGLALNILVQSGNVEAVQEYCNEIMQYTMKISSLSEEKKQLEKKNDQLSDNLTKTQSQLTFIQEHRLPSFVEGQARCER